MKKNFIFITVITIILSLVLIGFGSTFAFATGSNTPPIGTTSIQIEDEDEIVKKRGPISWYIWKFYFYESDNNK
jgi:hypothetical protein